MPSPAVPADFPRESTPASVAGAQPKVAARLVDGSYLAGLTDEDIRERYDMCEDLAQQLAAYCLRKAAANPDWTREFNLERAGRGVADKVRQGAWDVSAAERSWVLARVRKVLGW